MIIRCIAIDKNKRSLNTLEESMQQFKQLDLIAKFDNPSVAEDFLLKDQVDFIFLDAEFKNDFNQQFTAKLSYKPLLIMTNTCDETHQNGLFSNNTDYVLNKEDYPFFFQAITSMRESKS